MKINIMENKSNFITAKEYFPKNNDTTNDRRSVTKYPTIN